MYHTGPCPKLGTTVMQSASPQGKNVQVPTLKCWSRANHAITQEDVLLTLLCSASWSKQQCDALLTSQRNRPELKIRNRRHDLAYESGDLRFEGSLSVAKHLFVR